MPRDRYRHRTFDDGFPADDSLDFSRRRRNTARGRRQAIMAGVLVAGLFLAVGVTVLLMATSGP